MAHNKVVLRSAAAWVRDLRPRSGEWLGRLHGHIGLAVNVEVMRGILVERPEGSNSCSRFITVSPSSPGHARARTVLSRSRKDPEHKAHRSKNTHKTDGGKRVRAHDSGACSEAAHSTHPLTHTRTRSQARTRTRTRTRTHAHTHARAHTHPCARARARSLTEQSAQHLF